MHPFLFLLLAACPSSPSETGTATETTTPNALTTSAVASVCAEAFAPTDTAFGPEGLAVSDLGGGVVHVTHTNFLASCCLSFDAAATRTADRIDVAYTEVGEPCDCECPYSMGYDISAVPGGAYTVYAGTSSASVTVQ